MDGQGLGSPPSRWRHLPAALVAVGWGSAPLVFVLTGSLREPGSSATVTPKLLPWPLAFKQHADAVAVRPTRSPKLVNSLLVAAVGVPLVGARRIGGRLRAWLASPRRPRRFAAGDHHRRGDGADDGPHRRSLRAVRVARVSPTRCCR